MAVGDANTNADPEAHQVRAEGVPILANPHVPSGAAGSAGHHATGVQAVTVADGRLTLDAVGGTNAKVNYIEITPVTGGGGETVAQVNFQPAGATTPSGWSADSGALFDTSRGYGWVRTEGGVAKTADTRARPEETDPLDGTLMIVDDSTVPAVVDGEWEYALANGTYTVTVSVGDPGYADSTHGLTAEGSPVVTGFVPSGPGQYRVASATVDVTDGRLTLASSGTNTKVQWIQIASASDVDVIPPTVALEVTGVEGAGGYIGQAKVSADIDDIGGSEIEFVDWKLDGTAISRPAGDELTVNTLGDHTVAVTATDSAGNATTKAVSFTVVDGVTAGIRITNLDAALADGSLPTGFQHDLLVMHLLSANKLTHRSHDTARLQITDADPTDPLRVTALQLGAPTAPLTGVRASTTNFSTPGTTFPLTVPAGQSTTVEVLFSGTGTRGIYGATMTVVSNAENAPRLPVQLRGFWQPVPEGGTEPDLTQVFRTFGFTTDPGEPLRDPNTTPLQGDEVRSNLWKRLDSSKPVTVRQLSALHGCCTAADSFQITGTGGGTFAHDEAWGQSLLPRIQVTGDATAAAAPARAPSTRPATSRSRRPATPPLAPPRATSVSGCGPRSTTGRSSRALSWSVRTSSRTAVAAAVPTVTTRTTPTWSPTSPRSPRWTPPVRHPRPPE